MYDLATFRKNQEDMLEIIKELQSLMTGNVLEISVNGLTIYQLFCELIYRLQAHLGDANSYLYPNLLRQTDPRVRDLAWSLMDDEKTLREIYTDLYLKSWDNFHHVFTVDFMHQSQEFFNSIFERIDQESREILPWLEQVEV